MKKIYLAPIIPLFFLAFLAFPNFASAFTLSQNLITVNQGQTTYVTSSVSSGMSVSNSSNAVATVSLNGTQLTIYGVSGGQTLITVCVTGDGCQTLTVTVPATVTTSTVTTPPAFSSGNTLNMQAGASQTVTISGAGGFTLQSNGNPTVAGVTVVGNTMYIMANNTQGGDNVSVCDQNNQCSVLYISVSGTNTSANIPITLVSYTVTSSNNQGEFLHAGSNIQMSFNTNMPVTNANVVVGSAHFTANGSGTGPFTISYNMSGSEPKPLPVSITVSDANNNSGTFALSLGAGVPTVTTTTPTPTVPTTGTQTASITLFKFTKPLYAGLTSTEVLALQERLKAEGIYSGPSTGFYGAMTEAAVKAYQKKHGLAQLGNVGPGTRSALNAGN